MLSIILTISFEYTYLYWVPFSPNWHLSVSPVLLLGWQLFIDTFDFRACKLLLCMIWQLNLSAGLSNSPIHVMLSATYFQVLCNSANT